ncbi:hypothetical protein N7535_000847 [Penicillium sp. DV-2018c]|nr:hypothetical protein N7535_000847 [Penicillium sp. DV-2018c]
MHKGKWARAHGNRVTDYSQEAISWWAMGAPLWLIPRFQTRCISGPPRATAQGPKMKALNPHTHDPSMPLERHKIISNLVLDSATRPEHITKRSAFWVRWVWLMLTGW